MRKHPRSLDFKYGVLSRGSSHVHGCTVKNSTNKVFYRPNSSIQTFKTIKLYKKILKQLKIGFIKPLHISSYINIGYNSN